MFEMLKKGYKVSMYSSIVLLLIGLLLFINPEAVVSIISYVIGFFLIVVGISQIIKYYQNKESSIMTSYLYIGIVISVIGFILVIKPTLIATIIPVIVGIIMILNSIEEITVSTSVKDHDEKWYIPFIFGIATLVLGIFLVLNPLMGSFIVTEILGIIIVIYAILDIIEKFSIKKKFQNIKKEVDKEVKIIDAEE